MCLSTPKLQIPEAHRDDIALLFALDDIQAAALARALDNVVGMSPAEFAKNANVPNVEPSELARMFNAVRALYVVRTHENVERSQFVDLVIDAARRSGDKRLAIDEDAAQSFRSRLQQLLSAAEFSVAVKAQDLASDVQRELYGVRILTDLRPVFRDSASDAPSGLIIVHTLKLEYHIHAYRHEDIYISATEDRLRELQTAIDRALQKSNTLQSKLSEHMLVVSKGTDR